MGGTLSTMFTAIHQDLVKNLVLLATGIDFSTREGLINLWTDPRYFDVDKFVDTMGNVPAEFLQTAFLMLKPIANLVEKPINLMENIHRDEFIDDYLHMETWINDNIPVPGEVYREFAKYLFQQNLLTKNRMPLGRHIVDLRKITCPLLNLMARNDDLVPCAQSEPLNDLVSSNDKERSSGRPATLDSPSAVGLKKSSGREPLTGSSSAPIETRQFRPNLPCRLA
jgi:polyhydroxyalkanoate synthase